LLEFCTQQIQLSQEIVAGWLQKYMLAHDDSEVPAEERAAVADAIAKYFGSDESYDKFRTHNRPVRREPLEGLRGLRVRPLKADKPLQDAVLSVYHALDFTFGGPAVKIVENHRGARYVRIQEQQVVIMPAATPGAPGAGRGPGGGRRRGR
jgi:hypothetical protein